MSTEAALYVVSCEGPPLDYTARTNLEHADVVVLDDTHPSPAAIAATGSTLHMQLEATSDADALATARRLLASRPYHEFAVVRAAQTA